MNYIGLQIFLGNVYASFSEIQTSSAKTVDKGNLEMAIIAIGWGESSADVGYDIL